MYYCMLIFVKTTQNIMAHTVFTHIENFCMERVKPGEKVYFANLTSRLSYFKENPGSASEEEGERFHREIKRMEQRYQSRWNLNMIVYHCCMQHKEEPQAVNKRKGSKRCIEEKRKRYYKDL